MASRSRSSAKELPFKMDRGASGSRRPARAGGPRGAVFDVRIGVTVPPVAFGRKIQCSAGEVPQAGCRGGISACLDSELPVRVPGGALLLPHVSNRVAGKRGRDKIGNVLSDPARATKTGNCSCTLFLVHRVRRTLGVVCLAECRHRCHVGCRHLHPGGCSSLPRHQADLTIENFVLLKFTLKFENHPLPARFACVPV